MLAASNDLMSNKFYVLIAHIGTTRKTESHREQFFTHPVHISWCSSKHWLCVHGFPQRARLDIAGLKMKSNGIIIHTSLAWVYQNRIKPVVAIETIVRINVDVDTVNIAE